MNSWPAPVGTRLGSFGNAVASHNQPLLLEPYSLAWNSRQNTLLIVDSCKNCVESHTVDITQHLGRVIISTRMIWSTSEAEGIAFRSPHGCVLNQSSTLLWICDSDNNRLVVISACDGSIARVIEMSSIANLKLNGPPRFLTFAECGDHILWVVGGEFAQSFDVSFDPPVSVASTTDRVENPSGIANWGGFLFIGVPDKQRLAVYNDSESGKDLKVSISGSGLQRWNHERMGPTGLYVDRKLGIIYVTMRQRCISALKTAEPFSICGTSIPGTLDQMIDWPHGIAIDHQRGFMFVGFETHITVFRTIVDH